ncbi:amidohydrolase family protein [Stakelama marina]|uniref:Amidohydrolase family protein n=1 Tax=Stakelama marina TaxID=2826939 RepID=A0A8T4IH24_9SPHN|nr:amidohydrolase family protein [Stakelama marina]MBR0553332.1 amidohydrolase family protein [Stakelama marina]
MVMSKPSFGGLACRYLALCLVALCVMTCPAAAEDQGSSPELLIRNVRLVDFAADEPRIRDDHSVLVRDGRIVAVAPTDQLAADAGTEILEGNGRTLLPGLTDMHVHLWDEAELGAYLASGVTTVRNMSGMPYLLEMRDRIADGQLAGPRILTTGPILNSRGPNAQLNHQIVETAEEAKAAVRGQFEQGYRRIKVYSNLNRAAYEAILAEARALNMPITGHTPEGRRIEGMPEQLPFDIAFDEILDDGFESIEHVESIVWHGLRNRHDATRGRALARRIAAANVAVDPTLVAFANLMRIAETRGAHLRRQGAEMLNPFVRSMETEQSERWTNEDASRAGDDLAFYLEFTRMLADEGVRIVAGSDAGIATNIPGISLHDEFDLLLAAGLTPAQVLQAATTNAARVVGQRQEFGQIEPGQRADLLLVKGDPLDRIESLRHPQVVIAGGRVFDEQAVEALWRSAKQTDAGRTARNVLQAMEVQGTRVDLGH